MGSHRIYAAVYDRMTAPAERAGLAERRRHLLESGRGRVLEIGGGTGHNLPYYAGASEVVVLEPDAAMRRHLNRKLDSCPVPVRVVSAGIDTPDLAALGVEDGSFDTVVSTLVLCTVPDVDAAAARIRSLMAPGGQVLILEHVRGAGARGLAQQLVGPLWRVVVPGCHIDREPVPSLRRAGLVMRDYDRVHLPLGPLASPGVVGSAIERQAEPPVEPGLYPRRDPAHSGRSRP